jgi:hypothetical protein
MQNHVQPLPSEKEQVKRVKKDFKYWLQQSNNSREVRATLASSYLRFQKQSKTIAILKKVLEEDPVDAFSMLMMGVALQMDNKPKKAEKYLVQSMRLGPSIDGIDQLRKFLTNNGRTQDTSEVLTIALRYFNKIPRIRKAKGFGHTIMEWDMHLKHHKWDGTARVFGQDEQLWVLNKSAEACGVGDNAAGHPTASSENEQRSPRKRTEKIAIRDWLVNCDSSLEVYAAAFAEYGYESSSLLAVASQADLQEAFDEIKVKKPHRRLVLTELGLLA